MWPDGICRVTDTRYTKTIQYQDINYQLSQNEDKTAIFEAWCDFLNYFDSSVQFQLSFVNLSASQETFARSISIPPCGDEFDGIRAEYAGMLQNQLARGNNGLIKTKYLTFGVEADNLRAAKPRLERIETDLLNNFKRLGVVAAPLNGFERLHVMHDILRMDEQEPFRFSWDWLAPSGLSTKDFIAPSSFEFKTGRMFRMGKKLGAISFVQILAPELNDRMLADPVSRAESRESFARLMERYPQPEQAPAYTEQTVAVYVASSKTITGGSATAARAMEINCRCP